MQQLNNIKLSRRKKLDYLEQLMQFICFKQDLVYPFFWFICLTFRETANFKQRTSAEAIALNSETIKNLRNRGRF
jgi:hypothetical protein